MPTLGPNLGYLAVLELKNNGTIGRRMSENGGLHTYFVKIGHLEQDLNHFLTVKIALLTQRPTREHCSLYKVVIKRPDP